MEKETLEESKKSFGEIWSSLTTEQSEYLKGYINRKIEDAKKWQAEKMYSEEDMIKFAMWVYLEVGLNSGKDRTNEELFKEWFKQFKKK